MLSREKIYKIRNAAIIIVLITFFITLQYNVVGKSNSNSLINDNFLSEIAFADTAMSFNIKVGLVFNADFDGSNLVDGKDLALLMYCFGRNESEYMPNRYNVNPDINGDKMVDGEDLVILASHFGLKK
ncbi:MAG: hypothetical protein PHX78_01725 [bacterium]|nr:hypothetical protein [bacterium]